MLAILRQGMPKNEELPWVVLALLNLLIAPLFPRREVDLDVGAVVC
jgi:hypothetical protein